MLCARTMGDADFATEGSVMGIGGLSNSIAVHAGDALGNATSSLLQRCKAWNSRATISQSESTRTASTSTFRFVRARQRQPMPFAFSKSWDIRRKSCETQQIATRRFVSQYGGTRAISRKRLQSWNHLLPRKLVIQQSESRSTKRIQTFCTFVCKLRVAAVTNISSKGCQPYMTTSTQLGAFVCDISHLLRI